MHSRDGHLAMYKDAVARKKVADVEIKTAVEWIEEQEWQETLECLYSAL